MSMHHKLSLFYYILLDFDASDSRGAASDRFASAYGMPRNYQLLMKGLWYLDRQEFSVCIRLGRVSLPITNTQSRRP